MKKQEGSLSQTIRILLLDDNPDDRLLAIRELQREFSNLQVEQITEQAGFNQALAADHFDLAITDYHMGWSNGIEVLRTIKARYPNRPVIMFTNTASQETAIEAMKAGLNDYVLKSPKHYIRLPVAVRSALERAEEQRRAVHIENRLQSLLNRLNLGVFRAKQDGELLEGNAAFCVCYKLIRCQKRKLSICNSFTYGGKLVPQVCDGSVNCSCADLTAARSGFY